MQKSKIELLSDEELMSLYQAGDFAAFEILYTRHSGRVFEYLKKRIDASIAQELLQETFAKLHKSREKYNPQYPFLPWLFTISRNALMDFFKQAETQVTRSSTSAPLVLENMTTSFGAIEPQHDIAKILAMLPQNQKRAIELRYLSDWSFEKIASDMETSEENARKLISRGLKKIRATFKGDSSES